VTITKSITVDCTGTFGSILASGTNGINIAIAPETHDTSRTVRIRGLSINGAGSGGPTGISGIRITGAAKVFIENVAIDGFTKNGISVENVGAAQVSIYRTLAFPRAQIPPFKSQGIRSYLIKRALRLPTAAKSILSGTTLSIPGEGPELRAL
jgi:hypothetical protein